MYRKEDSKRGVYACFIKRTLDIMISLAGLIILALPMAFAALAVKICDGGSVIFKQERVGHEGRLFTCYKFRTMSVDAPHDRATRELGEPEKYITKVGRFLRKTSIDELPQLINVLRGDMSIIGPRPVIPREKELVELRRLLGVYSVRPGITGLAQVMGRDIVSIRRKAAFDARYVEDISFLGDARLLFKTFFCVASGAGIREGSNGKIEAKGRAHSFSRALVAAFGAQIVTAVVSAFTVFFLAGELDAAEYGKWQLFSLAASYAGLFQLGICDGVYLRLGGRRREELDTAKLGGEFRRMMAAEALISAVIIGVIPLFFDGARGVSLAFAALYMPLFNSTAFLGYILQATGRTALYSLSGIVDRVGFILLASLGVLLGGANYLDFILASILAKLISFAFCVVMTRDVVFTKRRSAGILKSCFEDISSGAKLMLANLSGHSICGGAKVAIIYAYGDAEFGRVSFVMTLSMVLVQFASQTAMVLFPSLRRGDLSERNSAMKKLNVGAGLFLPMILLSYLPIKYVVARYLPQYAEGLVYLPILLSMCVLEGRGCLVGETYHKVMRREGRLLRVNLACAVIGFTACFVTAKLGGGALSVLLCALVTTAYRVYMLDPNFLLSPILCAADHISNAALCGVFIVSTGLLGEVASTVIFSAFYLWYLYLRRGELKIIYHNKKRKAVS